MLRAEGLNHVYQHGAGWPATCGQLAHARQAYPVYLRQEVGSFIM